MATEAPRPSVGREERTSERYSLAHFRSPGKMLVPPKHAARDGEVHQHESEYEAVWLRPKNGANASCQRGPLAAISRAGRFGR